MQFLDHGVTSAHSDAPQLHILNSEIGSWILHPLAEKEERLISELTDAPSMQLTIRRYEPGFSLFIFVFVDPQSKIGNSHD